MSTKTTNFEFIKPEKTDPADITTTNENWDKLDEALIKRDEDLSMGGHRITDVAEPIAGSDVATRHFVEQHSIAGNTYVAVDYKNDGNVTLKPYVADEDELVFRSHIDDKNNPHEVTAEQIGLGVEDISNDFVESVSSGLTLSDAGVYKIGNIISGTVRFSGIDKKLPTKGASLIFTAKDKYTPRFVNVYGNCYCTTQEGSSLGLVAGTITGGNTWYVPSTSGESISQMNIGFTYICE